MKNVSGTYAGRDLIVYFPKTSLNVRQGIASYSIALREIALSLMKGDMEEQAKKYGESARVDTTDIVRRAMSVLLSAQTEYEWVSIAETSYRKHMANLISGTDVRKRGAREKQTIQYMLANGMEHEYVGQQVTVANGVTSKFLRQAAATQGWGRREWSKYMHIGNSKSEARRLAVQNNGANDHKESKPGGISMTITISVSPDSIASLRDVIAQLGLK